MLIVKPDTALIDPPITLYIPTMVKAARKENICNKSNDTDCFKQTYFPSNSLAISVGEYLISKSSTVILIKSAVATPRM